tara:strand:+ start:2762 stop:4018 length:1257 start_codon:yes stop_codon:yes gene_type:complete
MRVFKFGGASVKDVKSFINLNNILLNQKEGLIVIVSAMGKTTNKLEKIWENYIQKDFTNAALMLKEIIAYHQDICNDLKLDTNQNFVKKFDSLCDELSKFISEKKDFETNSSYDKIVSFGELWSTTILSYFIYNNGIKNSWIDARNLIKTSSNFQEARVNWNESQKLIKKEIKNNSKIYVTQGFIGSTSKSQTTTLGREGSDYSAAIFAWAIDATDVVIWKDVVGLLNADPKLFEQTVQLKKISYKEAIELSYLGASVIHPKTIKPLQNKEIPLTIRSFLEIEKEGSSIHINGENDKDVPSFIYKPDQILLSITTKDYSFIFEDHLSEIFKIFAESGLKVHLMQNSALSFSICGYIKTAMIPQLFENLSKKYLVKYNEKVDLLTVRHYRKFDLPKLVSNQEILIQQRSRSTIRYVLKK